MRSGSALLVGGSSEIGMAVLLQLLGPAPRRVVLAGRPSGELWRNAEQLREAGHSVSTTQYDAGLNVEEIDGMLEHASAEDPLDTAIVAVGSMSSGVRVLVVRPGFVATRMTADLPRPPLATSPERVARRVASAVQRQKTIVWVPGVMGLVVRVLSVVPRRLLPAAWR